MTISAHPTQQSLLEVAGLESPPHLVLGTSPMGYTAPLTPVSKLSAHKDGTYLTIRLNNGHYSLLVSLDKSGIGHAVTICV